MRRLALLSTVLAAALAGAAAPARAADLPALSVERGSDPAIVDDAGREVVLRGINVQQLGDYFQADPAQRTTFPLSEEDFAGIARLGFNVVRLTFNWSAFQPRRDAFDEEYVARVRQAVRWARDHGLYVVLDMHQDAWGKFVATKPGEACPPGFGPAVGWDGAPEWATLTDGLSTCRAQNTRELSPAVAQAFQSFYADREGIQTQLVSTWGRIARALSREPNVAGYDLLNEPHPGFLVGPDQSAALGRFYARAIEAIRAAEPGPRRVVFFEPSVLWSGFGTDATPPPGFTSDRDIVFAPHLYAESITVDRNVGITSMSIEQGFDAARRTAALYEAPLWSGEWGWFGAPEEDRPKLRRYAAQEDRAAIGGAWWVWRQACGDPHVVGYPGASGSLNRYDCPGDRPLGLNTRFSDVLGRAYPRHAPGRITGLTSDSDQGTFEIRGHAGGGSCRLEAWVPGTVEPALTGEGVTDLAARAVPGGFAVSGCARGAYVLRGARGEPRRAGRTPPRAACRSRRVIAITLRRRVRAVRVSVTGARARNVRLRGRRVTIDLRGRPRQRVVVRIRAGRRLEERRVYRTCQRRPASRRR